MGDLSEHFSRHEFACKCGCGKDTVDAELVAALEELRKQCNGAPITINSGNRCEAHNAAVGGVKDSYHMKSKAADIVVKGRHPVEVSSLLNMMFPNKYGIGRYEGFTHLDVQPGRKRWG